MKARKKYTQTPALTAMQEVKILQAWRAGGENSNRALAAQFGVSEYKIHVVIERYIKNLKGL